MNHKKAKEKNNRTHIINIRFNENEFAALQEKRKISNTSISEFIRSAVLQATVIAKMSEEERKNLRVLVGIATNLNQLAHKANSQIDFISFALDIQNTRREIDALIFKLNSR